jgi:hypothetical protein
MAIKNENCITNQGYNINHKKVYRLMKEAQLLQEKHQNLLRLGEIPQVFPSQPLKSWNINKFG